MSGPGTVRIPATLATSSRTCVDAEQFALQVTDGSMEPELPAGCVVVIDPGEAPRVGDMVVAETATGLTVGRLDGDEGRVCLVLDQPPTRLPLPGGMGDVRGVVVQRAGARRSTRKRYR